MANEDHDQALRQRLRAMSANDVSVLEAAQAALASEPILITTKPGSDNDSLWTEMVKLGWMRACEPLDVPVPSKVFALEPSAKEPLGALLLELKRDALPGIFDRLRRELPAEIVEPVIAAGGAPSDVALMLAGIVEATMRRYIRDELHEEFLADIEAKVRALAKGFAQTDR